jgi:hypothetical protein
MQERTMHAEHKYHISTNERLIVYCRLTGLFTNAARALIKKGAIFHCGGQEWEVGTYEGYDRWKATSTAANSVKTTTVGTLHLVELLTRRLEEEGFGTTPR